MARSFGILLVFAVFVANSLGILDVRLLMEMDLGVHQALAKELAFGRIPPQLLRPDYVSFLITGAVLAIFLPLLTPIGASLLTVSTAIPAFYVAYAYPIPPPIISLEYALLMILVLFSVNVLMSYFAETHERQKIISAFGQYVPPAVVEVIGRDPKLFSMRGESREMTVMFSDLKDFTGISEKLSPQELADMLNHYLTAMTDVLHRHGATIDKYIGDAIVAFWGAPIEQADHAERAVAAAIEMQQSLAELRKTFRARGWPELEMGIGINSGVMNVGNMGSRYRVAYTVMGDAVNIAARLETLTRLYNIGILITDATRIKLPTPLIREIDHVIVKGKDEPTRLYEPLSERSPNADPERLVAHESALSSYYKGHWEQAARDFRALRNDADADYYGALLERMETPGQRVPESWGGVIRFGSELHYTFN